MRPWSSSAAARTTVLLCGALLAASAAKAQKPSSIRELDKKIRAGKKDLKQIDDQIKNLESEGERLRQNESSLERTLKELDAKIENSTRRQVRQKISIRETEGRMKALQSQASVLSNEGRMWENVAVADVNAYHVKALFPQRLTGHPMRRRVLRAVLALRIEQIQDTRSRQVVLAGKEKDLAASKEKLVRMKTEMENEMSGQKRSKADKGELYKTTQGRRVIAEAEARKLKETREELEKLIGKLAERKEKTLAAQREEDLLKRSFRERRGNLPWPAEGAVTARFGRQKHPDLDITVISNGIKIKTSPGQAVKSVAKGTVVYASDFRSYGRTVIVDHGGETFSVYGLLGDITVKEGEKVASGKALGTAGDENPPQIYFELKNQGRSENPLLWLQAK